MKKRRLFLGIIPFMLLTSCTPPSDKKDEKSYSYEEERDMLEDALDNNVTIEKGNSEIDLTPLQLLDEIDDPTMESLIKFKSGDPNQIVKVVSSDYHQESLTSPFIYTYEPKLSDLKLVDENDNSVDFTINASANGVTDFLIPVSSFAENHFYHLKLANNKVRFLEKDESIRELTYYSLDVNDSNRVHTLPDSNEEIKSFDISKVQYFDTDAYGAYFIYHGAFDIDPLKDDDTGLKFRISDLSKEGDNEETTYGKLISVTKNPNGAGNMVRYEPCTGKDLYDGLDINDSIHIDDDTISNLEFLQDNENVEQGLAHAFLTHPDLITTVYGLMNHYKVPANMFKASVIDWASKINVNFNINFDGSTFTWGATLTLNLNPEDNLNIKIILGYKQTIKYDIDASLKIHYEWGFIPTGVDYKLVVKEDDTKEVSFKVVLSTNLNPYDEDKIKEGIENDLMAAFTKDYDVQSIFNGDPSTGTADGRSYPLLRFDCYYFFPLDIRFEIDFYWKLQLTLECDVVYTSHSQRTDVSINNSKGCDPSSETKATSDKSLTFTFMGKFHAEVGLKVSLGLGISGFYRFFHAEVYITAYGAVDAQGFLILGIEWGDDKEVTTMGVAGGKFEVSVGVKWGVDIELLFGGFDFEWPIVTKVLLGFSNGSPIKEFVKDDKGSVDRQIEVTDKDYYAYKDSGTVVDLDDYHFLGAVVFDANSFAPMSVDFKHDDGTKVRYGLWVDEVNKPYFSFEVTEGSDYITLDDYKIGFKDIAETTAEFTAKIKVSVDPSLTCDDSLQADITKIITVHYTNNNKQEIILVDDGVETSMGSYLVGSSVKLPEPKHKQYMKFTGWKNLTTGEMIDYDPADPNTGIYNVPVEEDIQPVKLQLIYIDWYYWDVVWVDGFGNVVMMESVFKGEAATPPSPEVRDQYMVADDPEYEYVFVGYDQDYSSINQNTVIRALYEYKRKEA